MFILFSHANMYTSTQNNKQPLLFVVKTCNLFTVYQNATFYKMAHYLQLQFFKHECNINYAFSTFNY